MKLFLAATALLAVVGAKGAMAKIGYGGGVYVNLCGTGTAATAYRCEAKCVPETGTCEGQNNGVVKYVCVGRWDQCLEAEGFWSNSEQIGSQPCGRTVQLSVYDKKCRRDDGSWDNSCRLQGYMVWYSGDCWSGVGPTPTPYPQSSPARVTPTMPSVLSPTPTTTAVSPSPAPSAGGRVCNKVCAATSDCGAGFTCHEGKCRNPACRADASCFCGQAPAPTATRSAKRSPETGGEELLLVVLGLAAVGGILANKAAARLW